MNKKTSNANLLIGLKKQLQGILHKQHELLETLEKNSLVPIYDEKKPLVIDDKNVSESKSILQGEYKKLENFEVVLAVVGTMKAGKSTTINAIVGREILPNRNRPMTSLPTLIAHKKGQKQPILTLNTEEINQYLQKLNQLDLQEYTTHEDIASYKEIVNFIEKIQAGYTFKTEYQGEHEIFDFLAELNDLVRLSRVIQTDYTEYHFPFSAYKEINALPRIEVEFTELAQQDEQMGNLVLLDTPGPNEANLPELKEIFEQQLKRSSAVMVVMDYTQLKSQADADIREELDKLPKIEKERLFALVNKFDQKNANSDDESTTKNIVANDLLKGQIELENVYCISAQDAFLATRLVQHIQTYNDKPSFDELEWVKDFAKKAYGTRAERTWKSSEVEDIIADSQDLAENSKLELPLKNVIMESYKNAPKIAMKSALKDVESIFTNIDNYFSVHGHFNQQYEMTVQDLERLKQTLEKLEQDKTTLKHDAIKSLQNSETAREQAINEINEKFKQFEDVCSTTIQTEIHATIKYFENEKKNEYEEKKGKGVRRLVKIMQLNESYAEEKSRLKAELDGLMQATGEDGVITLSPSNMQELSNIVEESSRSMGEQLRTSLFEVLNPTLTEFNQQIDEINSSVLGHMSEISKKFKENGIEIKLSPLKIDLNQIKFAVAMNLFGIAREYSRTRKVESTSSFSGVKRWFGKIFKKGDWGYEDQEIKEFKLNLSDLNKAIENKFSNQVVHPIQSLLKNQFEKFTTQMHQDITEITLQAEELINELGAAYETEKLPYEDKKKHKDVMNDIARINHSIQKEVETVQQALPKILGETA